MSGGKKLEVSAGGKPEVFNDWREDCSADGVRRVSGIIVNLEEEVVL